MSTFGSVDAALDFAIAREEESARYYQTLAQKMPKAWMAEIFQDFAQQEVKHKQKLQEIKAGGSLKPAGSQVADLKIADYLVPVVESAGMNYQDALTLAMHREKAAYKLYRQLAQASDPPLLRDAFLALAQEEANHKLWMELEYDKVILQEN